MYSASTSMNRLADVSGNGLLAGLAKEACKTGKTNELDRTIIEKVQPMLYNEGEGAMIQLDEIIEQRHRERTGNCLPDDPFHLKKFVCWKLGSRGTAGETLLHTCFLSGLPRHMQLLAERLLFHFPLIINDIFLNDEFYGITVLHMGIVSEDPKIVHYLLRCGADVNARSCGKFFACDDQKSSRMDCADIEHVVSNKHTNYKGLLYWGESPLSFAAVLSQTECFRMLIVHGADVNASDSNGNTVLHICTIRDNWDMFKLALSQGASIRLQNRQNFTPLTLSCHLGKKDILHRILHEVREVSRSYADVEEVTYPLEHIDSIDWRTGKINLNSALAIIVHGKSEVHSDLIPGVIEELVKKKWGEYGKRTLQLQLLLFTIYFLTMITCFVLRPTPFQRDQMGRPLLCLVRLPHANYRRFGFRIWAYHVLNVICVVGAVLYILQMQWHIKNVGSKIYFFNLKRFPVRAIFILSCFNMILSFPLRLMCVSNMEDIVWMITILMTGSNFLFFCSGFEFVGPFALIVSKMVRKDLLRFFIVYSILVMGFSQAFYIIFLRYHRYDRNFDDETTAKRPMMHGALDSVALTFLLSLREPYKFYEQLHYSEHPIIGKALFIIYMFLVALLLMCTLIAMLSNSYQKSSTRADWLRQWSAIVLTMEMSFEPKTRIELQKKYSIPMEDGRRGLHLTIDTKNQQAGEAEGSMEKRNAAPTKATVGVSQKRQISKINIKDQLANLHSGSRTAHTKKR